MAVPDPKRAEQHLRILTQAPHVAGTPEDLKTAEYVAEQFRKAGLETEIVEYKVWFNLPKEVSVTITAPPAIKMSGPSRERVISDPYQDDPRVIMPFNGFSPSGDVEAEVVYANYGAPADIAELRRMGIDVKGKILLVRYGKNFRGVKSYVAEQAGAAGVIIYSDPIDDGWFKGDKYPDGPWRPDTGVQRGSVQYIFKYPGDPTTPGVASLKSLPDSQRLKPEKAANMPRVPTTPLSYADARPILENLRGPQSPREWQGALPFTYHVGPGPVRVRIRLQSQYGYHTIWNVIGRVRGSDWPDEWVVAGNHRDAWTYGAVDPNSGTSLMLEAAFGIGELLKAGWKPKRTIVFASWDAEEQGLIGSTEWAEQHAQELANAAAYFNTDSGAFGPNFSASSVPSLRRFIREITRTVPSPAGGSVYDAWMDDGKKEAQATAGVITQQPPATSPHVGDLGSGSDYTPFLQHLGVPSTDVSSSGSYGVYHSVFDNFAWFKKFGDPDFRYVQQMARVFGLQVLRMASADVLPFDYEQYGNDVLRYAHEAQKNGNSRFGPGRLDLSAVRYAARRLAAAGASALKVQAELPRDPQLLNCTLRQVERELLLKAGLPGRPWYKHSVYAPGEYTGYAAVTLPGVNGAIDKGDLSGAQDQAAELAAALIRAAHKLEALK